MFFTKKADAKYYVGTHCPEFRKKLKIVKCCKKSFDDKLETIVVKGYTVVMK